MRSIITLATPLALVPLLMACSSGLDRAKEEMTSSCVDSANGQLTVEECSCMTDEAFATLNDEERDLMGAISSMDPNADDGEIADQLGMSRSELRSTTNRVFGKMRDARLSSAMSCVT